MKKKIRLTYPDNKLITAPRIRVGFGFANSKDLGTWSQGLE